MRARKEEKSLAPLKCAVVAVLGYCLLAGPLLVLRGPAWFMHVGMGPRDADPPTIKQVERILGYNISHAATYGHDGREFWVIAQDPLLLSPVRDASLLDRPSYRAARIAYPALAAPWDLLGPSALLIGLLVTNLLVVGLGTYFTTLLALQVRAPPLASVFFFASPLVAVSVLLDLGDALSLAALVASYYLFKRSRFGWATFLGVVAVLAKQPALLGILAVTVAAPTVGRRIRLAYVGIPTVILLIWTAYVTLRLGPSGGSVIGLTWPFLGYAQAMHLWLVPHAWADAAAAMVLLPAAALVVVRWWQSRSELLLIALPFALLVPFLSQAVLYQTMDSVRAFGPAITFFGLDLLAGDKEREVVSSRTGSADPVVLTGG